MGRWGDEEMGGWGGRIEKKQASRSHPGHRRVSAESRSLQQVPKAVEAQTLESAKLTL